MDKFNIFALSFTIILLINLTIMLGIKQYT